MDDSWSENKRKKVSDKNNKHERWNKDIESVCENGSLFWMKPDFESALGLPHNESEKIDQAMQKFTNATKKDIPQSLTAPIEFLISKVIPC